MTSEKEVEREPPCEHEYQREEGSPVGYACIHCHALPPYGWYPEPLED